MHNLVTKEQLFKQLVKELTSDKLFFGHGVIDAEDEAMMIMMHLFNEKVSQILASGNEIVKSKDSQRASQLVRQRIQTLQPMSYILGHAYFCGLTFYSDQRALVPRSPIAELILDGFSEFLNLNKITQALDLCTGSGCIGLSLAYYQKHLRVDLSDISLPALELAKSNVIKHKLEDRINIIHSDLFESIDNQYDLILSNPPYVSEDEYNQLPTEYKKEPKLGLVTRYQGLEIPLKILIDAPNYLTNKGVLFLEVGYSDQALELAISEIPIQWVEFSNGGQGVCVFSYQTLIEYQDYFKAVIERIHVI